MTRRDIHNLISAIVVAMLPLMVVDYFPWLITHYYHLKPDPPTLRIYDVTREGVLVAGAAFFGVAAGLRHPINSKGYVDWLRTTPWRPGLPLPLGPVTPGWIDYLIASVFPLTAILYLHRSPLPVLTGLAVGYLIHMGAALARAGPKWVAVALLVGMGALSRVLAYPMILFLIAALMFALGCWGAQRSLLAFPWGLDQPNLTPDTGGRLLERLGPQPPDKTVRAHVAWTTSLVCGWLLYCILWRFPESDLIPEGFGWIGAFGLFTALIRVIVYIAYFRPPISFWGRIFTGRWIIPGYDYVFLAPLAVIITGVLLAHALSLAGASAAVALAGGFAGTLLISLIAPPTRRQWLLTGKHRIQLGISLMPEPRAQATSTTR
jgi:hypothetical protein